MEQSLNSEFKDKEIPALTGLRGFAALWVFVLHACFGNVNQYGYFPAFDHKIDWGIIENFILEGHLAVDIFFVLSGFILTHVYLGTFKGEIKKKDVFSFHIKRLARIYPVHLFITTALAVLFFTSVWQPVRDINFEDVLLSLSLLNVLRDPSVNIPAWSISAEWFAYLLCPFIIFCVHKMSNEWILALLVLVFSALYPALIKFYFCCNSLYGGAAILRVTTSFLIGAILYKLFDKNAFVPAIKHGADILCLASFGLLFTLTILKLDVSYTYPVLPFVLYYLALSRTFIKRAFASKTMVFLGTISYCIYMVHYPVLELADALFSDYFYTLDSSEGQTRLWLFLLGLTLFLLIAASALYYGVEKPCRAWITKTLIKTP